MGAQLNFDASTVDPRSTFEPIPNGTYRMHITSSEVKATKDTKGRYLQLVLTVLDGDYKGRQVWERLNIVNSNPTAQDIAQRQLSAICHATGVMKLANSSQLHHIPMLVTVVVKQSPGYDPQNEVKKYEPDPAAGVGVQPGAAPGGGILGAPGAAQPTPNAVPAAAPPPWANRKTA